MYLLLRPWSVVSFSILPILCQSHFKTKLLVSVVWIVLAFLNNSSYTVFWTFSLFTRSLNLLEWNRVVSNLSISNLSVSYFMLAKPSFLDNIDVSTPVAFSKFA